MKGQVARPLPTKPKERPCVRCGKERRSERATALCLDCRLVMTPAEIKVWAA